MSTINLLPVDYIQRRWQRRPNMICMILFTIVMGSVGGAALVAERSSRNTREVCERINAAYADAAKLIDKVHRLETQKREMLQKAKLSAGLMERLPRSYVLAMLTNALPEGASLVSLDLDVKASRPAGDAPKARKTKHSAVAKARKGQPASVPDVAVEVTVKGRASTDVQVARFIASLAKHPLMEMVDLSYSKESSGKANTQRDFELRLRLKPNADALDGMVPAAKTGPAGGDA